MKKIAIIMAVLAVIFTVTKTFADGVSCGPDYNNPDKLLKSAEDYLEYNQPGFADTCIDEVFKIPGQAGNTKAYFTRGKVKLSVNDFAGAKEIFSNGPVKAKFSKEIADLYKVLAGKKLAEGDMKSAKGFYNEMMEYNPSIAKTLAVDFLKKGKEIKSDNYLEMAVYLDPSLGTQVADHYDSLPTKSEDDKVRNLKRSSIFDSMKYGEKYNNYREQHGRAYLEKAKENAKLIGKEAEAKTAKFKALAREFLGDATVNAELPEVFILSPNGNNNVKNINGLYFFDIKKGEKTPYWIGIEYGTKAHLSYSSTNNKFEVRYKKNPPVKVWAGEEISGKIEDDERIFIATEDTTVFVKVVKK
jgi:hypothetical protein